MFIKISKTLDKYYFEIGDNNTDIPASFLSSIKDHCLIPSVPEKFLTFVEAHHYASEIVDGNPTIVLAKKLFFYKKSMEESGIDETHTDVNDKILECYGDQLSLIEKRFNEFESDMKSGEYKPEENQKILQSLKEEISKITDGIEKIADESDFSDDETEQLNNVYFGLTGISGKIDKIFPPEKAIGTELPQAPAEPMPAEMPQGMPEGILGASIKNNMIKNNKTLEKNIVGGISDNNPMKLSFFVLQERMEKLGYSRAKQGESLPINGALNVLTFVNKSKDVKVTLGLTDVYYRNEHRVWRADPSDPLKDAFIIEAIYTDPKVRGQGKATQVLKDVLSIADELSVSVKLEPVPIKELSGKTGMTKEQLISSYKRLGFQQEKEGLNQILTRTPNASKLATVEKDSLPVQNNLNIGEANSTLNTATSYAKMIKNATQILKAFGESAVLAINELHPLSYIKSIYKDNESEDYAVIIAESDKNIIGLKFNNHFLLNEIIPLQNEHYRNIYASDFLEKYWIPITYSVGHIVINSSVIVPNYNMSHKRIYGFNKNGKTIFATINIENEDKGLGIKKSWWIKVAQENKKKISDFKQDELINAEVVCIDQKLKTYYQHSGQVLSIIPRDDYIDLVVDFRRGLDKLVLRDDQVNIVKLPN